MRVLPTWEIISAKYKTSVLKMPLSIFTNWFGGKKKQKQEEDEVPRPPERRLSISKSGRMKEKNKHRQTLTDGLFDAADSSDGAKVNTNDSNTKVSYVNKAKEEQNPSLCSKDEELDIDDVIRELQQSAL